MSIYIDHCRMLRILTRDGFTNFEIRGPRSPPPPRMKTSLLRTCSNKVTLTFQKQLESTSKRGGGRASAPPLNPPMLTMIYHLNGPFRKCFSNQIKLEKFENNCVLVWTENILKTKLFENDDVTFANVI